MVPHFSWHFFWHFSWHFSWHFPQHVRKASHGSLQHSGVRVDDSHRDVIAAGMTAPMPGRAAMGGGRMRPFRLGESQRIGEELRTPH
jgi:hypothetical protein